MRPLREKTPRVLSVVKRYHPSRGGMETYMKQVSEGLVARGIDCTVIAVNHVCHVESAWEVVDGVSVRRVRSLGKIMSQPVTYLFTGMSGVDQPDGMSKAG